MKLPFPLFHWENSRTNTAIRTYAASPHRPTRAAGGHKHGVSEASEWFAGRSNFVSVELGARVPNLEKVTGHDSCHGHDKMFRVPDVRVS
jgi:hypothetical protein